MIPLGVFTPIIAGRRGARGMAVDCVASPLRLHGIR